MRALVTGGTGFLGANLVSELTRRGIDVRVLHRASSSLDALDGLTFEPWPGDLFDGRESLARAMAGCEWVFHLAAISDYWRSPSVRLLYRVNVEGTRNVAAAAREAGVDRFVFTSSLAALGLPPEGKLLDENSYFNLSPRRFPYGHSKYLAEGEVLREVEAGLPAVIVNPTVVIGPRDVNRLGGSLILEASRGRAVVSPPGGVNFVAVEDVACGHIAAAQRASIGERYILAGENLSYQAALEVVSEVVGKSPPLFILPRPTLPLVALAVTAARWVFGNAVPLSAEQIRLSAKRIYADGSKAVDLLDVPQTSFETAVRRAYAWYEVHGYLGNRTGNRTTASSRQKSDG